MDATTRPLTKRKPIAPTARAEDSKKYTRSRITNHADLLPGVKGTSSAARRFRDLVNNYIADLGGIDLCGQIKIGRVRRLAATEVLCELIEASVMDGKQVDIATFCQLESTYMRLSARLPLERVQKPIPGLHDAGGLLDQIARKPLTLEQDHAVLEHEDSGDA